MSPPPSCPLPPLPTRVPEIRANMPPKESAYYYNNNEVQTTSAGRFRQPQMPHKSRSIHSPVRESFHNPIQQSSEAVASLQEGQNNNTRTMQAVDRSRLLNTQLKTHLTCLQYQSAFPDPLTEDMARSQYTSSTRSNAGLRNGKLPDRSSNDEAFAPLHSFADQLWFPASPSLHGASAPSEYGSNGSNNAKAFDSTDSAVTLVKKDDDQVGLDDSFETAPSTESAPAPTCSAPSRSTYSVDRPIVEIVKDRKPGHHRIIRKNVPPPIRADHPGHEVTFYAVSEWHGHSGASDPKSPLFLPPLQDPYPGEELEPSDVDPLRRNPAVSPKSSKSSSQLTASLSCTMTPSSPISPREREPMFVWYDDDDDDDETNNGVWKRIKTGWSIMKSPLYTYKFPSATAKEHCDSRQGHKSQNFKPTSSFSSGASDYLSSAKEGSALITEKTSKSKGENGSGKKKGKIDNTILGHSDGNTNSKRNTNLERSRKRSLPNLNFFSRPT